MENGNDDSRSEDQPSLTNPQCKVCTSSDRFEIEVALAQGQSQEAIARRFSRNGQVFSRQNVNSHHHRHMQVIERAVVEKAAERGNRMLDVGTAIEIEDQNERNRALMREQVSAQIENNQLKWSVRDVMAFIEQDARLGEQRNAALLEGFMGEAGAFAEAVQSVVPQAQWQAIVDEFDERMAKDGWPTGLMHPREGSLGEEDDPRLDEPRSVKPGHGIAHEAMA
jgi:hypothetical protein